MPLIAEGATRADRTRIERDFAPRPVLLATLSVRIDPAAERVALDSALETGAKLIVANMLQLPSYPLTVMLAREYATLPDEEDLDAVRGTADRAAALGVRTELLRISSRRPVTALIELAQERGPGLVVFGPKRAAIARWRFRSAARRIRRELSCLVWIAPDG
jgi:hypothetical protein